MSIESYIGEMGDQGDFQSQGSFTIGWDKALDKLKTYKVGDPKNFLIHLISAGCAFGARNITIEESETTTTLTMHDCYVSQQDVQSGFSLVVEGSFQDPAFDLAQGLQSGIQLDFDWATLAAVHPEQPSYRFRLDQNSEQEVEPMESHFKVWTQIVFERASGQQVLRRLVSLMSSSFTFFFGSATSPSPLGGYAGMSGAARKVDERCDFSPIPITINRQLVVRPLQLPRAPLAARVGDVRGVKFNSLHILDFSDYDWTGALAFQAGSIRFVIHGLSYPLVQHPYLNGIVWAEVDRDLSRHRILSDQSLKPYFRDLEKIAGRLHKAERQLDS